MPRILIILVAAALAVALLALGAGAYHPAQEERLVAPASPAILAPTATDVPAATSVAASTPLPATTPLTEPTRVPTPEPTPTTAVATPRTTDTERTAEWRQLVNEYLGNLTGDFGVIVKDLKTGETLALNPSRPFPSASLYKLGLLYEVLKEADAGNLSLETKMDIAARHLAEAESDEKLTEGMTVSIDRSLWFLITLSSNSAAAALHDYVSWADMNASLRELGLANTRLPDPRQPRYGDWRDELGSTTPQDMLRYFELAYRGELLNGAASEKMMYLLRNQQIDDRLSAKLPEGVVMAHKTGNVPGTINDVGIIFGPQTDLFVCVLSQDADYETTTQALQGLGRALFDVAND